MRHKISGQKVFVLSRCWNGKLKCRLSVDGSYYTENFRELELQTEESFQAEREKDRMAFIKLIKQSGLPNLDEFPNPGKDFFSN